MERDILGKMHRLAVCNRLGGVNMATRLKSLKHFEERSTLKQFEERHMPIVQTRSYLQLGWGKSVSINVPCIRFTVRPESIKHQNENVPIGPQL